ncbi:MAG: hypothetical protein OHK0052_27620 [Anaerolineales bacterium]
MLNVKSATVNSPPAYTIAAINRMPADEKRAIYTRLIPPSLLQRMEITPDLHDADGNDLLYLNCPPGSAIAELALYHEYDARDPLIYGQITDTFTGQLHIMLYIINNPNAPRFDIDRTPDGKPTKFGVLHRNLIAEEAAMNAGLAPGQIRKGMRMLTDAVETFENFVHSLGHDRFFAEPLYYHNAVILERVGFNYQQGRKLMQTIEEGFSPGGTLHNQLNGSSPFRQPHAAQSVRLRSWAIHDGIMGEPFQRVTMYKILGKHAGINTCPFTAW